jgi:hypothetical protein
MADAIAADTALDRAVAELEDFVDANRAAAPTPTRTAAAAR